MKKMYFFLLAMFTLLSMPMSAQTEKTIVTSRGEMIKSGNMADLKQGDKLLLWCEGDASRRAWLYESDHQDPADGYDPTTDGFAYNVWLYRELEFGAANSWTFLWELNKVEHTGEGTMTIQLKSANGNWLGQFPYNPESAWTKWPGFTADPAHWDPTDLYVSLATDENDATVVLADSLFFIKDGQGVFFNGQNCTQTAEGMRANFVGWNNPGGNSIYKIYKPEIVTTTVWMAYIYCYEADPETGEMTENELEVHEIEAVPGQAINAPEIEHYTFKKFVDFDQNELPNPYIMPEGEEPMIIALYEKWPMVTIELYVAGEEEPYKTLERWGEKGSILALPTQAEAGIGYKLVTTGYEEYEMTKDETIRLEYEMDGLTGLPVTPSVVEGGEIGNDATYYFMKIRDAGWIYAQDPAVGPEVKVSTSINPEDVDAYAWVVTGTNNEGFQLYNKKLGGAYVMYAEGDGDGTDIKMAEEATIDLSVEGVTKNFKMSYNNNGFSLAHAANPIACMNQFGGATGERLAFWTSDWSPTDGGSKIIFTEMSLDDLAAYPYANTLSYLKTQDCVGGYTAAQLAALKAAYDAKDIAACNTEIENINAIEGDTIAFDEMKIYNLISAYTEFNVFQPNAVYAMNVKSTTDGDSVQWSALEDNDAFKWTFKKAEGDTTYCIYNVATTKPIVSFRFGKYATTFNADSIKEQGEDELFAVGMPAPFELVKSGTSPAAYRIWHKYGASNITLAGYAGVPNNKMTGNKITTYNSDGAAYMTAWRLKPVGDVLDGIENTLVVDPANQKQTIFDLSGRRVNKAAKGIYIVNGKKVLVK